MEKSVTKKTGTKRWLGWILGYLKRLAVTFLLGTAITLAWDKIVSREATRLNDELISAIHKFDFPAVVRNASDMFYTHTYVPSPQGAIPVGDPFPRLEDVRHFSVARVFLAPFLGYVQLIKLLLDSWQLGLLSFVATSLALIVGFSLVTAAQYLLLGDDTKADSLRISIALWLAPFVGGAVLWAFQPLMAIPF